jgi:hypothetical protein
LDNSSTVKGELLELKLALLSLSMNLGFALTLALSLGRGNKRFLAPFSLGRRVGDEGEPYLHSATPLRFSQA